MNTTYRTTGIIIVIVIILGVLGYLVWGEDTATSPAPLGSVASSTSTGGTSVAISTASSSGNYTVAPVKIVTATLPTAPNYKAPLAFSSSVSAAEQVQDENQFSSIQTTLTGNPTDWTSWMNLGILRQQVGDYQGAVTDWTYVTEIYATDPTAYADLANLYATSLNQPSKAIADYKRAISLDPTQQLSYYQNLAQVYINENDTVDAKAILEQGIKAKVIGYQNLQTQLNSMQ